MTQFLEGYYEIENEKEMENAKCKIKPGLVFYELLLKYAEKGGLRLNFPETAMADREGNWHLLFTSQG